jgi:hypothetical protein
MKHPLLCLLSLVFVAPSQAGDAFFSPDGKTVTYVPIFDGSALRQLNLQTKKIEHIPLNLPKDQSVVSLVPGTDGETLFLTEKAAWVHDAKGTRKLCDAGEAQNINDLAVAPSKDKNLADWLFIAGSDKEEASRNIFFCRKPGEKTFKPTFCRRTNYVSAGVFTAGGRFFFANEGDLWEGEFEAEDGQGMLTTLNGVRIAPLGFLNTDAANGGSMYVNHIMPVGSSIYVTLGGHHMGQLLRIAMNPKSALSEGAGANEALNDHYAYLAKSLSTVQIIDDSGEPIRNAAAIAINGTERVFFGKGGSSLQLFLWDKATGKVEEIAKDEDK